jgi:hypothetical protein
MIGDLYTFKGRTVRVLKRWGKPDPLNPVLERGWRGGDLKVFEPGKGEVG